MSRPPRTVGAVAVLAVLFLFLHLLALPRSLEDLDSINFALGVRHFDVAQHQPHPPGYPVFIAAAKVVDYFIGSEPAALSILAAIAGALGLFALASLFRRLDPDIAERRDVLIFTMLTAAAPLYWVTAARPLSDVPGLAAALGIQALALGGGGQVIAAAFCAGLGAGIRSQVVWLTVPLVAWAIVRRRAGGRTRLAIKSAVMFGAGVLLWFVPLVIVSGGLGAYWRALSSQGLEDLTGVQMLWTTRTPRQLLVVLHTTLIAPWGWPVLAGVILTLAAVGGVWLAMRRRSTAGTLVAAFGPYLLFDLLFQESITTRYALPLLVPIAYLVVRAAEFVPRRVGSFAAVTLCAVCFIVAQANAYGYWRLEAPAFRLLQDMAAEVPARRVLAMHRREALDLRRPIQWMGGAMAPFTAKLAAPPKREWLEVVDYWNAGGRDPVWFVADPLRSDLALIDHREPYRTYRWPMWDPALIGGTRPNEMDWYLLTEPSWYLGEGWSVTPETAGLASEWRRTTGASSIRGWIRRRSEPVTLLVGGRNLAPADASIRITLDGTPIDAASATESTAESTTAMKIAPGFFTKLIELGPALLAGSGDYALIEITGPPEIVVEQFDAQSPNRVVMGFGDGWHEREYDPRKGQIWRWMSDRGVLRVRGTGEGQVLVLDGVTETFSKPSRVTVRVGQRVLADERVGARFSLRVEVPGALLPPGEQSILVETDQVYVPADTGGGTEDRRRLGLKVFDCRLVPARTFSGLARQAE